MRQLPSKAEILAFVRENPTKADKREIARAFGLKGIERAELNTLLKEMREDGSLVRRAKRAYGDPNALPPVAMLIAEAPDNNGDIFCRPANWEGEGLGPRILYRPSKKDEAVGGSDRILCKVRMVDGEDSHAYVARLIKRIGRKGADRRILGVIRINENGGRIVPVAKGADREWFVPRRELAGAEHGELVEAEPLPERSRNRMGPKPARVIERLGDPSAPRSVSLIAIHEQEIPMIFPEEAIKEAVAAKPVTLGDRMDLRHLPLMTIDPPDARDHDDAVCALRDEDTANEGGFIVWVAIADVAHYVRPGSALDREARKRGNSSYFPDRVVPMLPEELSADLCSLHEGVDRACIALEMKFDAQGKKLKHRFVRGLMRSPASLAYRDAQDVHEGKITERNEHLVEEIKTLFEAYKAVSIAREARAPLHLDLPERKIELDEEGNVTSVAFRDRYDAHKLIEEFMILSNVCAAETLEQKKRGLLYRVHEEPGQEKMEALRETMDGCGLTLAKGQVLQTRHFNRLLDQAAGTEFSELVNMSVLRTQTQAYYNPENFGHFGLNLQRYAHFTSPIRRYADLIVHRALISAHNWGPDAKKDGQTIDEQQQLNEIAEHISMTERRSMTAERDTNDRYLAAYMSERVGQEFEGTVAGVARFGFFVKLDETGADGLVPLAALGREYYVYDEETRTLTGERSRKVIGLGQRALIRLAEAVPVTGGLLFELLELEGAKMAQGPKGARYGRGKAPRRKLDKSKIKNRRMERKDKRRR